MNHAFSIIPLTIEARGEIITNNLPEFRELVHEALANINRELKSDEEFGQAELDVKALKEAEDAVRAAAVKSFDDKLKALVDGLNETAEEIRAPRLELEKLIAKRKDEVKAEIVEDYLVAFDVDPTLARKHYLAGLQNALKGKRTVASMDNACMVYQKTQQAMILKCREVLDRFEKAHGADLTMDRRTLELETPEGLEAELRRRFEAKRAADEQSKLKAEADAARADAEKAKRELAESSKPPAPPENVTDGPWSGMETACGEAPLVLTAEPSAAEEWAGFKAACIAAFGPIKIAREGLKHSSNIAKAQGFANAMNAGWKEWA